MPEEPVVDDSLWWRKRLPGGLPCRGRCWPPFPWTSSTHNETLAIYAPTTASILPPRRAPRYWLPLPGRQASRTDERFDGHHCILQPQRQAMRPPTPTCRPSPPRRRGGASPPDRLSVPWAAHRRRRGVPAPHLHLSSLRTANPLTPATFSATNPRTIHSENGAGQVAPFSRPFFLVSGCCRLSNSPTVLYRQ